jgi:hypothetical protein
MPLPDTTEGPVMGGLFAGDEAEVTEQAEIEALCRSTTSDLDNAVASGWNVRIGSTGGEALAHTLQLTRTPVQADADARRIAACCRAFAGVPTVDIENGHYRIMEVDDAITSEPLDKTAIRAIRAAAAVFRLVHFDGEDGDKAEDVDLALKVEGAAQLCYSFLRRHDAVHLTTTLDAETPEGGQSIC